MKLYNINEIIPELEQPNDYYIGVFEDTSDPDVEWPHRHHFFSLVWFTNGSGINVIDFDEYDILPNRIFTVNPKQIHNWNYSIDCKGYFLLIEEHLANHLNIEFASPYLDIQDEDADFLRQILKRMTSDNNQETAIKYLFSILNISAGGIYGHDDRIISEYKRVVAENYKANPTVEQSALKINVSSEALNEICKRKTGLTAKQLQLDIKITEAKRLLLYSMVNISEIAYMLGFEDSSYFSRIFNKKTGCTPNLFQKKYLNNQKKS